MHLMETLTKVMQGIYREKYQTLVSDAKEESNKRRDLVKGGMTGSQLSGWRCTQINIQTQHSFGPHPGKALHAS